MKLLILFSCIFLITSCTLDTPKESESIAPVKELKTDLEDNTEKELDAKTYFGNYFKIAYPKDFKANPDGPILNDGNLIDTDEATFISPDGTVEFFVYSPQWGGTPKDYLEIKENEKVVSEDMQMKDKTLGDQTIDVLTTKFTTVKDKNDKYTRSIMSQKTESTNLVFGIKYKDQASYDKYKAKYITFKKSLVQFAD